MTSLATIIGLAPMALKLGTGSEQYAPGSRHDWRPGSLRDSHGVHHAGGVRDRLPEKMTQRLSIFPGLKGQQDWQIMILLGWISGETSFEDSQAMQEIRPAAVIPGGSSRRAECRGDIGHQSIRPQLRYWHLPRRRCGH